MSTSSTLVVSFYRENTLYSDVITESIMLVRLISTLVWRAFLFEVVRWARWCSTAEIGCTARKLDIRSGALIKIWSLRFA